MVKRKRDNVYINKEGRILDKRVLCDKCGRIGHEKKACFAGKFCFKCKTANHWYKNCEGKRKEYEESEEDESEEDESEESEIEVVLRIHGRKYRNS